MSNIEANPAEVHCEPGTAAVDETGHSQVEVISSREVPLGGPRAMRVRRTLPQRKRSLIGAWCFADHYGPDDVTKTGGMDVAPHPHTGLQTVSWLFSGEIEHRDSNGVHAMVRPGEMNLMTGGYGICHSEVSTPDATIVHGVQLWIALPEHARHTGRDFQHHAPPDTLVAGGSVRVFLGSLAGRSAPVDTFSPLVGAEIILDPAVTITLEVDPAFEHGALVDTGPVELDGTHLPRGELGYVGPGRAGLRLGNPTAERARVILLGGQPLDEEIIMWWNFVGRSHEEIVRFRQAWQDRSERFGEVEGYQGAIQRLPAPTMPNARLRPRRNPPAEPGQG